MVIQSSLQNDRIYNVPLMLIENSRETIWTWSFEGIKIKDRRFNFFHTDRLREVSVHSWSDNQFHKFKNLIPVVTTITSVKVSEIIGEVRRNAFFRVKPLAIMIL